MTVLAYPLPYIVTVTQVYGNLTNPAEPAAHGYAHFHTGIDLGAQAGTPVLAAADGVVVFAAWDTTGFGNLTKIHHPALGLYTLYGHQKDFLKVDSTLTTAGDTVVQGEPIGHVDSTGNSTGNHLHFEVRRAPGGFGTDTDPGPSLSSTGTVPVLTVPSALGVPPQAPGGGDLTGQTAADLLQADPSGATVAKPIGRDRAISLAQIAVAAGTLETRPGLLPHCLLAVHLSPTQAVYLPVLDATVADTSVLQPGSWQATLSLVDLQSPRYTAALSALVGRTRTQVTVLMGYVADPRTAQPGDLVPMLTGVVDGPNRAHYTTTSRQLPMRGPDLSGLLSASWASGALQDNSLLNLTASQIATRLATQAGLHSRVQDTADPVGGFDGTNLVLSRQGMTDWDLLTQLAAGLGYTVYVEGTTLYFWPDPPVSGAPIPLLFQVAGQQTLCNDVEIALQAHSKHEYKVVVQSYDTKAKTTNTGTSGTVRTAGSGNPDAPTVVTVSAPPNLSQKDVQARADALLADYANKEIVVTAQVVGAMAVPRLSPVHLQSDTIWAGFLGAYQVVSVTYRYSSANSGGGTSSGAGIRQTIVATSRPLGLVSKDTSSTLATAGGF